MRTRVTILPVLVMILLSSCRTVPILKSERVSVRCPSREHMRDAIVDALKGRRWVVTEERPDAIDAAIFLRRHTAKIRINYDADFFDISFLDSTNLKYKKKPDGTETIHKNYNSWVQNLSNDIRVNAGRSG